MKQSVTTGATERNWVTLFKQYENIEELNRRVLMALVDRILIYEDHAIEIVFKYKDEYQQTLEYVLGYADELAIADSEIARRMARKSRKIAAAEPVCEAAPLQIFPTAIYARLSVENSGKSEKVDVITNQIEICKSYIAGCPYLDLVDVYVDNGRTGTVFDRPEFNRLMTDIKSGRIKCLVVRDLSRFGRDYIETGTYLERIFPQIGLRFIAIKEHYDNFDTDGSNESLMIPLQNMINALYSKDISRKVSTALKAQMEQGTFQKRNLPYGYRWNEDHTNMVIDEETAQYVRLMFQWKIEGWSIQTILNELDRLGAPNTELRKRQNGTRKGDGCSCKGWYSSTLYGILSNPHYVGDTVLGRSMKAIYKGIKSHNVKDKDKWIVFPNTHEALISREDFQKVQDILQAASEARQTSMQKTEEIRATLVNLFEGKIVCADCGKKMYFHRKRIDKDKRKRWYAYYECSTSVGRRYEHCTSHYTRQTRLKRMCLQQSSSKLKQRLTMTSCWISSGAARARRISAINRMPSLQA